MTQKETWYRMEAMVNGEWQEVGRSVDRNQARLILENEYGGKRRIKEIMSDPIVDHQDEYRKYLQQNQNSWYANFYSEFLGEFLGELNKNDNSIEREEFIKEDRTERLKRQLDYINYLNYVQPPLVSPFIGILNVEGITATFTKVNSEPREKVNWKEEGF